MKNQAKKIVASIRIPAYELAEETVRNAERELKYERQLCAQEGTLLADGLLQEAAALADSTRQPNSLGIVKWRGDGIDQKCARIELMTKRVEELKRMLGYFNQDRAEAQVRS